MNKSRLFSMMVLVCIVVTGFAQSELTINTPIEFCGVDFSIVKIVGATESPSDIKKAFPSINNLFLTEREKYDIGKYFEKNSVEINVNIVSENNLSVDENSLKVNNADEDPSIENIRNVISKYKTTNPGVGLVFIATKLDKVLKTGRYYVIFFDKSTKTIIKENLMSGRPGGFGFRNFWAASIYDVMKKCKKADF
jgi:hypothetical protein